MVALPGRANIVLTRQRDFSVEGVLVAHDEDQALMLAESWINADAVRGREIVIFGGGEIYAAYLDRTTKIELTEVDLAPEGAARFPAIDPGLWQEQHVRIFPQKGISPAMPM